MHFDYLHVGKSGPQASQGLPEDGGFRYILVIMHDLSNFVSMETVVVCTAEATAESLLTWCKPLVVPRVWVSDAATQFKNAILTRLREALCKVTGRRHRVSPCRSAYFASPWWLLTLSLVDAVEKQLYYSQSRYGI